MFHTLAVLVHRYVGLALSVFLMVAGVTGSILVFNDELDAMVTPELLRAEPPFEHAEPLPPGELHAALRAALPPGAAVSAMYLERKGHASASFTVSPGPLDPTGDDQYFVDPYTAEVLGSRRWSDLSQGAKNIIPFVYNLHYSLALGTVGGWILGIAALLWTFDCFVGAYLTFPGPGAGRTSRGDSRARPRRWLSRWARAWWLKTSKLFSFVFTWHRASGLWLWALLLMFAWSGVALTLYGEVYEPVMTSVLPESESGYDAVEKRAKMSPEPGLSWSAALERGELHLSRRAVSEGFNVLTPDRLRYFPKLGHFQYRARTSLDITNRYAQTAVWFDGDSGEFVALDVPTGRDSMTTATAWLYALHFGSWTTGGIVYRVLVCVTGLLVGLLSVSGVWIWWRKRSKRHLSMVPRSVPARAELKRKPFGLDAKPSDI